MEQMVSASNTSVLLEDEVSLPCVFESIGVVSTCLDKWLAGDKVSPVLQNDIHVCLDEIICNLVDYSQAKEIRIKFVMTDNEICITILDDGMPFDPLAKNDQTKDTEIDFQVQIGGLGIMMVREMTKDMLYQYENGQNNLGLYFNIA